MAATVSLLAAIVALWLTAPLLSAPPHAALDARYPAPSTTGPAVRLDSLIDDLPIIVRNLPDNQSRLAVDEYDVARLFDSRTTTAALFNAVSGLRDASGDRTEVDELLYRLVFWEPPGALEFSSVEGPIETPELSAAMGRAWPILIKDRDNAGRLNNLAVFLFVTAVANRYSGPVSLQGLALASPGVLEINTVRLLRETERIFGGSRALRLNLAYLRGSQHGCVGSRMDVVDAAPAAQRQVAADPSDRTARLLAASLVSHSDPSASGLDLALSLLAPLIDDSSTAALGLAARGEARLATASLRSSGPFGARQLAKQALDDYNRALADASDAGLYAGRAKALSLLGANNEAEAAQSQAVALEPESIQLRLQLAVYQGAAGDISAMRRTARDAFDMAVTSGNPLFRQLRFGELPRPGDIYGSVGPGFLADSVLSPRDIAGVWDFAGGGCGEAGSFWSLT